jgi:DNA-binding beta-propeller fold protein YncE
VRRLAHRRDLTITITPDGKTGYVTNNSADTVKLVNLATGTAGIPIVIGGVPSALAITPDGKTVYVADQDGTVTPIATATNKLGKPTKIGSGTNSYPASLEEIIFMPSGG